MKYFVCNCFYELKLHYGVISIQKLTLKDFGIRYTISVKNDCCYICCRETILFLFEYYRNSNFYFAIADDRVFSNQMAKSNHNEDIYLMSEEAIFFDFSSRLILFSNGPV